MKASIIITTYKRSSSLYRAIESCFNQDFAGDYEIIVVDDNGKSTGDQLSNEQMLSEWIEANKIIYVALVANQGACLARNQGADCANGEYLFFLDDDDEFLKNKLSKQISFLDTNSDYDAYVSAFIKKRNGTVVPAPDAQPIIGDFKNFLMHGNFYTPMLCIRRAVFLAVGGFRDIPRYQDIYFMYHLLASDKKVYAGSEALYILNEHSEERISNSGIAKTLTSVSKLSEFVQSRREMFTDEEWRQIKLRHTLLLATSYYSGSYLNRLKSISYWKKSYQLSNNKSYFQMIVKSFIPNFLIKKLEQRKHKIK